MSTARRAMRIKATCAGGCAATSCGDTPLPACPTAAAARQAPFQAWQEEGRLRLLAMLQRCMIRASKAELWNLPRLHRTVRCWGGRAGQPGQQAAVLVGSYGGAFCGCSPAALPASLRHYVVKVRAGLLGHHGPCPPTLLCHAMSPPATPVCALQVTLLDFAPMHAKSYNYFVEIVRFNLITSDWWAGVGLVGVVGGGDWARRWLVNPVETVGTAGRAHVKPRDEHLPRLAAAQGYRKRNQGLTEPHLRPPPARIAACPAAQVHASSASCDALRLGPWCQP